MRQLLNKLSEGEVVSFPKHPSYYAFVSKVAQNMVNNAWEEAIKALEDAKRQGFGKVEGHPKDIPEMMDDADFIQAMIDVLKEQGFK